MVNEIKLLNQLKLNFEDDKTDNIEEINNNYCEWCRQFEKNRLKCKSIHNLLNGA